MTRKASLLLVPLLAALGCESSDSPDGGGGTVGGANAGGAGEGGSTSPTKEPPVAAFTATPASGPAPLQVSLDASESSDADGEIVSYSWAFDGAEDEGMEVTRSFETVGCHAVELTVTDDDGETGTAARVIVVALGEPQLPPTATVEVAPLASAVLPRDLATDEGIAHFEGTIASDGFTEVRADVMDGETVHSSVSIPLCGAAPVLFDIDVPIPSELKAFEVRLSLVGAADPQQFFSVSDLVAGDIYVVEGQSNASSAQYSGDANENQGPFIRSFGTNSNNGDTSAADISWRTANGNAGAGQGAIGQWPMRMAALLATAHQTPIGLINGADPGKPIAFFQRNDEDTIDPATNYGRLLMRMKNGRLEGSVRAFLWYQGESDGDGFQVHHDGFLALKEDWAADYAGVERIYVTQVRAGCGGNLIALQEVQRQLADDFEEITVMSTTGLDGHDGCHFAYENGYRELGDHYAALLGRDLYDATPEGDVQPPNPASAQFAGGGTQLVIEMRNAESTLTFQAGANADFRFEGASATLTGATVRGNSLVLAINGDASAATGVSYLGHQQAGPGVKNENGVGLLEFYNLPIEPE